MRLTKVVFVTVLVLAVAGPAWAVTVPPPGISPFTSIQCRNQDVGTGYTPPASFVGDGIYHDPNTAGIVKNPVRDPVGHEDTWGIFATHLLSHGDLGADGIDIVPGVPVFFSNGDGSNTTWVVGMFYGGVDQKIQFLSPDPSHVSKFSVLNRGLQFDIYAVDPTKLTAANMLNLKAFNSGTHTIDDRYPGWVDANTVGAGSGATFLMHGSSQYFEFIGQQTDPNLGPFKFDGTTNVYFDVDPNYVNPLTGTTGAWANVANSNHFPTPQIDPNTDPLPGDHLSDVFLTFTDQGSSQGWDTFSSDQGGWANVSSIPEPLTMVGLFLGVGGLGRYLRRRFA